MNNKYYYIPKIDDFTMLNELENRYRNPNGLEYNIYKVKSIINNNNYLLYKIPLPCYWGDFKFKNKLNNVFSQIKKLKNKNIVDYYYSFIDKNSNCFIIITEYLKDTLFNNIIQKQSDIKQLINEDSILNYINDILNGVLTLHNLNIFNLDFDSQNFYVLNENIIKLNPYIDIYLNLIYFNSDFNNNSNELVCPELVKNSKKFSIKSDIWYLGLLIYEICTLKKLKRKYIEDYNKMFNYIRKGEYEQINKKYSKEINILIKKCLNILPERRPNCEEIKNICNKIKSRKLISKKIEKMKNLKNLDNESYHINNIKIIHTEKNNNHIKITNNKNFIEINKSKEILNKNRAKTPNFKRNMNVNKIYLKFNGNKDNNLKKNNSYNNIIEKKKKNFNFKKLLYKNYKKSIINKINENFDIINLERRSKTPQYQHKISQEILDINSMMMLCNIQAKNFIKNYKHNKNYYDEINYFHQRISVKNMNIPPKKNII
jgi:hypothetical protein